jgi:hypothetical protein
MFKELAKESIKLINELSNQDDIPKEEKLERVAKPIQNALEAADDIVMYLPPGLRTLAKAIVDNNQVDAQQETLAKAIAEVLYQGWRATKAFLG